MKRNTIASFALVATGFAGLVSCASINLGNIGNVLQTVKQAVVPTSEEEEQVIGQEASAVLLGAGRLLPDERAQTYVNRVGMWVAMQSERPDLPWRFGVLEDDDINAFAAPGGYILITRGLLFNMRNEAELAGVLAHEIAHVVERHHLEAIQKEARLNLAGMVAKEALARRGKDTETLEKIAQGAKVLYTRGLDKEDEFEADRMGVVLAARAGYDPYGLPAVLHTLDSLNPEDGSVALLFKTHPKPADRIAVLDAVMLDALDRYARQPRGEQRFITQLRHLAE